MCNLKEKTNLKTVTIYKGVIKIGKSYYGYFAGTKINLGIVHKQTRRINQKFEGANYYERNGWNFNPNMVGKVSGFKLEDDANSLIRGRKGGTVLKIVLSGEIWIGNAYNIDSYIIPENNIVYAGSEILSYDEI